MAGWLLQVTPLSVQLALTRSAWSVRLFVHDAEYRRNVADCTIQPDGMAGRLKRTSARLLLLDFAWTLRMESVPLFEPVLPESIHASAFAGSVTDVQETGMVVAVGGTGVAVGGNGVAVGGTDVAVGGNGVFVAVGGTGVAVGGTGVAVGGTGVFVAVGGTGVAVGGTGVAVGGTGVFVAVGGTGSATPKGDRLVTSPHT